jgi:hypothetical protein
MTLGVCHGEIRVAPAATAIFTTTSPRELQPSKRCGIAALNEHRGGIWREPWFVSGPRGENCVLAQMVSHAVLVTMVRSGERSPQVRDKRDNVGQRHAGWLVLFLDNGQTPSLKESVDVRSIVHIKVGNLYRHVCDCQQRLPGG